MNFKPLGRPGGFDISEFRLVFMTGEEFDFLKNYDNTVEKLLAKSNLQIIENLVISEELASPIPMLEMNIRDTLDVNLFRLLDTTSFVKLKMRLVSSRWEDAQTMSDPSIDLEYVLYEVSDIEKSLEKTSTINYTLTFLPVGVVLSDTTELSIPVRSEPDSEYPNLVNSILKIVKHLKLLKSSDKFVYEPGSISNVDWRGVVPLQKPIDAIKWLAARAEGTDYSRVYAFSRLSRDEIHVSSLYEMCKKDKLIEAEKNSYKFRTAIPTLQEMLLDTSKMFEETRRVISISSVAAKNANKSPSSFVDYVVFSNRPDHTYPNVVEDTSMTLTELIDKELKDDVSKQKLGHDLVSFLEEPIGRSSTGSPENRAEQLYNGTEQNTALLNSKSYHIILYGDLELSPGKIIFVDYPGNSEFTGYYLINASFHSFMNDSFTTHLSTNKIMRESEFSQSKLNNLLA